MSSRVWIFDKFGWMALQQLFAYHRLISIYIVRQSKEPEHLADILTRDNMFGRIIMKNSILGLYRNSLYTKDLYFGTVTRSIKKAKTDWKFKKHIRKWVESNVDRFGG